MGIVYSAVHEATGLEVALKTLHRRGSDRALLAIRREVHALQKLRHPSIVRILDHGVTDGIPWYAMELLRGRTLRERLSAARSLLSGPSMSAGDQTLLTGTAVSSVRAIGSEFSSLTPTASPPSGRRELLDVMVEVCSALGYMHSAGVVHRDLKPENIFIREDGHPVLVDFGICARFAGAQGREVLETGMGSFGTLAYMAPEHIRGELADARADLYSLGCILYECFTGASPFAGASGSGILGAHLHQIPVPPSHVSPTVSAAMDRLILSLLEKDPRRRLGYADDVIEKLCEEFPELGPAERHAQHQAHVYRPPFVGRETEQRTLTSAVRALVTAGRGGLIYLTGESGTGKTRLAMEIAHEAMRQDLTVVVGQCGVEGMADDDGMQSPPLGAFAPILTSMIDHCSEAGGAELQRVFGARGKLLAPYQPELTSLQEYAAWPEPPPVTGLAGSERTVQALVESIVAWAGVKPRVVVIDDLQWADELSRAALASLARLDFESLPLLVLCTYRAEEESPALRELVESSAATRITLERFRYEHIREVARGMLGMQELPPSLIALLDQNSDGNPFFVVEYLRAEIQAGALTRRGGEGWSVVASTLSSAPMNRVPTPARLASLMARRVRGLATSALELLLRAAVLGREVDVDVLVESSGLSPAEAASALDELRRRYILEDGQDAHVRFVHDRLRSAAYETIGPRVERMHADAARCLERRLPDNPSLGQRAGLGMHWSRADVPERAKRYFREAGKQATELFAYEDALGFYESCLKEAQREAARTAGGDSAETASLAHEAMGEIHLLLGRRAEAKTSYEAALAQSTSSDRCARLWRRIGKTYETQHSHDEALAAYSAAERELGAPNDSRPDAWWTEWIALQVDRVMVHYWLARESEIEQLVSSIRTAANEHGSPQQRAQLFKSLAYMSFRRERYALSAESVAYAEHRLEASRAWGDAGEILEARFMYAMALLCNGAFARAEEEIVNALPEARKRGDITILCRLLAYLTMVKRRECDVVGTRESARECLEAATAGKLLEYVGVAHANLAWVALRKSDSAAAARECQAALEAWKKISFVYPFEWMARLVAIALELPSGDPSLLVEHARRMLDPKQHLLPAELSRSLSKVVDGEHPVAIRGFAAAAVALAELAGFL